MKGYKALIAKRVFGIKSSSEIWGQFSPEGLSQRGDEGEGDWEEELERMRQRERGVSVSIPTHKTNTNEPF